MQPKEDFVFPDFSVPEPHSYYDNPKQGFQDTIDSPPSGQLGYYVGTPIHSLECTRLVHPGPKLAKRGEGDLPGINTPYWYISTCHGAPANLHIEYSRTGSPWSPRLCNRRRDGEDASNVSPRSIDE